MSTGHRFRAKMNASHDGRRQAQEQRSGGEEGGGLISPTLELHFVVQSGTPDVTSISPEHTGGAYLIRGFASVVACFLSLYLVNSLEEVALSYFSTLCPILSWRKGFVLYLSLGSISASTSAQWVNFFLKFAHRGTNTRLPLENEEESFEATLFAEEHDDGNSWFYDIRNYLKARSFPSYATSKDKDIIRHIATRPPGKARKKGSNGTIPPSPKNERGNVVVLESPHSLGTMKQLSGAHSTTELTAHHAGLPGPVMPKAREMGFLSLSFLRPYVAIWEGPGGVKGDPINLFRPRIISLWAWSYFTVEKQKKASIFKFNSDIARFFFGCEPVPNQNTQQALALPEKEVIQSHLPVRLPCYDFTLVTSPAFDIPLLAVKVTTSGMASSRSVTGGVHKAREQIHCRMADRRLLVILASCSLQSELRMGF
ncbi:hypothetical protein V6N11_029316 [Hibiscus sabdariffa]|uniref:Uncharacterized protein n=1 Tax=Hibiscus sabdariffa TaxID=183260 RepID=A0ABR2NF43_9ROSI